MTSSVFKRATVKSADVEKLYERPPSFTDLLPWTAYLPDSKSFVLDDGISVAALLELAPLGTEAASEQYLTDLRDLVQVALVDALPEELDEPWVLQLFVQDDYNLSAFAREVQDYGDEAASRTEYRKFFGECFRDHIERVSQPGGLFIDDALTGSEWIGKRRRSRAVIYRRQKDIRLSTEDRVQALRDVVSRFCKSLSTAGVRSRQLGLEEFRAWLVPWFNPRSYSMIDDTNPPSADSDELEKGDRFVLDIAETLLLSMPRSEVNTGIWYFDDQPAKVISVQGLRRVPQIGHLTAERQQGDRQQALFDGLPQGTVLAMTVIAESQAQVANRLSQVKKSAVGDTAEASLTREHVNGVEYELARGNKLFYVSLAFFIHGKDAAELQAHENQLCVQLLTNGIQPIAGEKDLLALDSYLRNLPMAYDHSMNKTRRRAKLMFAHDTASLLPVYGHSRGSESPGLVFFNRTGEPLYFDPLNPHDRKKNAHLLVLGPTGSGKSAMLTYLLQQIVARHRPRVFIIEAGGSFQLLSEHFMAHGLTVHRVTLVPDKDVSLPPFAAASELLDESTQSDGRDRLSEMEIIGRVMVTGGDPREVERLTRSDRLLLRHAILGAAKNVANDPGGVVLTENIVESLRQLGNDPRFPESRKVRTLEMADSMELFCSGIAGHFFNRPGNSWPDVDITVFEMGLLARDGYEDQLTVAYLSLMAHINELVERQRNTRRQTLVVTDEAHVILTHPLLANYVVKITKMWRKFGAWFWLATQNLADFPDESKRMLNMIEWWLCLAMPKDEIEQLTRFREITEEQRRLLLSARKEPGKYVEGVVFSDVMETLFRNVPPALSLALAMSEKFEKAKRHAIMGASGCTEYEAACQVAEELKLERDKQLAATESAQRLT